MYDIGIGANWTGFFSRKSLLGLVFRLGLVVMFGLGCIGGGLCGWFRDGLCGWLGALGRRGIG